MTDIWSKYISIGAPISIYTDYNFGVLDTGYMLFEKNIIYQIYTRLIPHILIGRKVAKNIIRVKDHARLRKYLLDNEIEIENDNSLIGLINQFLGYYIFEEYDEKTFNLQTSFEFPIWKTYKIIETPYYSIESMILDNIQYIRDNLEIKPEVWYRKMRQIIEKRKMRQISQNIQDVLVYHFVIFNIAMAERYPEDAVDFYYNIVMMDDDVRGDDDNLLTYGDGYLSDKLIDTLYMAMMAGKFVVFKVHEYNLI